MIQIIRNGGLGIGGMNLDVKARRNFTNLEDTSVAHVIDMDAMARTPENAAALLDKFPYKKMLTGRYAPLDGDRDKEFEDGELTLKDAVTCTKIKSGPRQTSGKQELYEAILNMYRQSIFGTGDKVAVGPLLYRLAFFSSTTTLFYPLFKTMNSTTSEGSRFHLYLITSVAILGGLFFGHDTAVMSGAERGLGAFFLSASNFQYSRVVHGAASFSALIDYVPGGALSDVFTSRLEHHSSLQLATVLFFLSALDSYYPGVLFFECGRPNMDLLIAFNLYHVPGGIGVGLTSTIRPIYTAEIAPPSIRGTLVSCNQLAIIFGVLVVYFVNYLVTGDHQNPIILKDAADVLLVSAESDMWTV